MLRPATQEEIALLLSSDGVRDRVPHDNGRPKVPTYMVNERALALLNPRTDMDVEMHLMAPRIHWAHLRSDVGDLINALIGAGYQNIYTGIDDQYRRTQNLAKKCGFEPIYRSGSEVIYRWQH